MTPSLDAQILSLRSGGAPLAPFTRTFFERRFGSDFGGVRVHSGPQASQAAKAVRAQAFTVGRDIVFGQGQYSPESQSGQKLLAHELAHTLQQQSAPALRRRVVVHNPSGKPPKAPVGETNENIVRNYVTTLCPGFTVSSGELEHTSSWFCPFGAVSSRYPRSCYCLCTMHDHEKPLGTPVTWTVVVDDLAWPNTDDSTKTVTVQSPYSGLEFGAWGAGKPAHRIRYENWLVFAHEICGHGSLYAEERHPEGPPDRSGGRPSHDPTVDIENAIASEHGVPPKGLRGKFSDPHHGESFTKVTVQNYPFGKYDVELLDDKERRKLDTVVDFMSKEGVKADVIGHADKPTAQPSGNAITSTNRAVKVKKELIRRGIKDYRFLYTRGVGASQCDLPGKQPSCRKVEIFMFGQTGASVTHPW